MSIKLEKFPYLLTTLILLLFAPFVLAEEIAIRYGTASEEIFSEPHDIENRGDTYFFHTKTNSPVE